MAKKKKEQTNFVPVSSRLPAPLLEKFRIYCVKNRLTQQDGLTKAVDQFLKKNDK